jgi:6-phosphogluconate dehydrogenase
VATIGIVGLGRMGGNMLERLRARGVDVVGFDLDPERTEADDLLQLLVAAHTPKLVWLMLPAGGPTDAMVAELTPLLTAGDTVVDGGNANWRTTVARAAALRAGGDRVGRRRRVRRGVGT